MAKVWKVINQNVKSSLPTLFHPANAPRVFYTLYERVSGRTFVRVSSKQYMNQHFAYTVYANRIAQNPMRFVIRPVMIEVNKAQGITHFTGKGFAS
jgi:hypothetical protein